MNFSFIACLFFKSKIKKNYQNFFLILGLFLILMYLLLNQIFLSSISVVSIYWLLYNFFIIIEHIASFARKLLLIS